MKTAGRFAVFTTIVALTLFSGGARTAAQGQEFPEGQDLWRSCAACHCVPDLRIPDDENWLQLNETTTCISGAVDTPEIRSELNAYLRSEKTIRPVLLDEEHTPPPGTSCGRIRVPSTAGSAYLKAERASIRKGAPPKIRLRWNASEKGKTLALPAGEYRVITYSFYRSDEKKRRWCITGTSAEGCAQITVSDGEETSFDLVPEVEGSFSAEPDEAVDEGETGFVFAFFMTNEEGDRMSISRDGALVNPTWVLEGAEGKTIEAGAFEVT